MTVDDIKNNPKLKAQYERWRKYSEILGDNFSDEEYLKELENNLAGTEKTLEVLEQENKSLKDELAKDNEIKRLNEEIKKLKTEKSFRLPENYKEKVKKVLKEHNPSCENTESYRYETYMFTPTEIGTIFSYKCPKCGNVLFVECDNR